MERHKQQSTNRMPAGRPFCTDTYNAEKNCHTDLNALLTSGIAAFSLITALRACMRACVCEGVFSWKLNHIQLKLKNAKRGCHFPDNGYDTAVSFSLLTFFLFLLFIMRFSHPSPRIFSPKKKNFFSMTFLYQKDQLPKLGPTQCVRGA